MGPLPQSRLLAVAVVVCVGGLLAACVSLSKEECLNANWRTIGYSDGAAGRTADYIARHQQACARVDVTPDLDEWLAGREEGLPRYCTPANAYSVGRRGSSVSPVCPEADAAFLAAAHAFGRRYYEIGREIYDLEADVRELRESLTKVASDDWRERHRLEAEIDRVGYRIISLRVERDRYETWPPVGSG